jgi:hypothetical protein
MSAARDLESVSKTDSSRDFLRSQVLNALQSGNSREAQGQAPPAEEAEVRVRGLGRKMPWSENYLCGQAQFLGAGLGPIREGEIGHTLPAPEGGRI